MQTKKQEIHFQHKRSLVLELRINIPIDCIFKNLHKNLVEEKRNSFFSQMKQY